ncbi:TOR signaling pathway transcriptional corepressor Crf1 [Schizosaccharomyces japonicus yFS275]|uniref:TOR signaling pathway transcriptional corepressor Crf1 n=1 Tax=Schizosaccharomyces japonicus (strain yFS275 / FY16936) TaxID=402676 RepID=B6K0V5_SCHJY|nr:TOR signaling pathway transcriptional corepressor Crf1 [Schizosaccharomyces japonicus yFS275]EEB07576.1 TOR signaling pathway transcriptional corepressor Crf1 [Schizosaccharomyces japonicus yFS275]
MASTCEMMQKPSPVEGDDGLINEKAVGEKLTAGVFLNENFVKYDGNNYSIDGSAVGTSMTPEKENNSSASSTTSEEPCAALATNGKPAYTASFNIQEMGKLSLAVENELPVQENDDETVIEGLPGTDDSPLLSEKGMIDAPFASSFLNDITDAIVALPDELDIDLLAFDTEQQENAIFYPHVNMDERLEDDFLMGFLSSEDEKESTGDEQDDVDLIGWECFFDSSGDEMTDYDLNDFSEATDDELPTFLPTKEVNEQRVSSQCVAEVHVKDSNDSEASDLPVLGVWALEMEEPNAIIDGSHTLHVHDDGSFEEVVPFPISESISYGSVDDTTEKEDTSVRETNLEEILDTSLIQSTSRSTISDSCTSVEHKEDKSLSRWDRIPIGTFRRNQYIRSMAIKEELVRDEWCTLAQKTREKRRQKLRSAGGAKFKFRKARRALKRRARKLSFHQVHSDFQSALEERDGLNDSFSKLEQNGFGLTPELSPLFETIGFSEI